MKTLTFKNLIFAITSVALVACNVNSDTAKFKRIDALDDSAWEASSWISAVDAPVVTGIVRDGDCAADGTSSFITHFTNEKKVASAKWMVTSLGIFEICVNGESIGEEILRPGFTHYEKTKRSFTYDVTGAFKTKAGEVNILEASVTPGWWADKIITPSGHEGMIGKKCAFRGVLELTYTDGTKKLIGTDTENWRTFIDGPVLHAGIFDGEVYNANPSMRFYPVEEMLNPELNTEFCGEILPSDGAEVYLRHDIALSPVKAYVWEGVSGNTDEQYGKVIIKKEFAPGEPMVVKPGETLVVDFGQNSAAVPSFEFCAKEGTILTCLPSELLNDGNGAKSRGMDGPEGSTHRLNLRSADTNMILKYTFDETEETSSYTPARTFFGYRYVSITATDKVTIKSIASIPVSSITKEMEIGKITTGNRLVNQLISNTIWGQRSNYLSVTTDCPQRNERLGWTADTQVFTETGTFFANTDKFFHKWLRDLRDTQSELGGFPGVAPQAQYGATPDNMMRVGWADAGVIVPWTVWKQFGDLEIIEESWESMEKFMDHVCETKYDHETLSKENGNYQWADWLSYEPLETCSGLHMGQKGILPEAIEYWNYLSASYWMIDAGMMLDMAKATGRNIAKYENMVNEAKTYIIDKFLNNKGDFKVAIFNTMQTPALFALKNGIVEGAAKENMIARLRENFAQHGNCLQTGFLGTSILMATLTDNSMSDIAYELLFQRKNPSWLYSVDNGATTIWERWNSYMLESGMGPRGMNSFNHYAYGCVCEWIWETAAGIASDPAIPGFKHIVMNPIPDKRLGYIDAEYNSAAGLIKSAWKYEGDKWIWNFTIPEGASASVTVPGETSVKEYSAGSYTIEI